MPSPTLIRPVTPDDAPAIADIYSYYVENTCITFEYESPSAKEMQQRIEKIASKYPWFVALSNGEIAGYAYATQFRERDAYRWNVETSVYVKASEQRKGIATALYNALLDACTRQGFYRAIAVITLPNEKSVAFHKGFGFNEVGVFNDVGFKMDAWHNVMFLDKALRPADESPSEIQLPALK